MNDQELSEEIFATINRHTLPGVGITRPSYSAEETGAMRVVERYAQEFGLETFWDSSSNLHCLLRGTKNLEMVTGSHLDSVPHGGRFDGVAGVVAGLLALQRLKSLHSDRSARLIVLRGEESAWFGKCYLGSLGLFNRNRGDLARVSTHNGMSLAHSIAACGGSPDAWQKALDPSSVHRFYEVHIEQGPVLHQANEPLGIVTGISGNRRFLNCEIVGESGHSGTTPMSLRQDALLAFAHLIRKLEKEVDRLSNQLVFTCGIAGTDPDRHALTIIPDRVKFSLEFRSPDDSILAQFNDRLLERFRAVAASRGCQVFVGSESYTPPVALSRDAIYDLGTQSTLQLRRMPSGAGHDAAVFAEAGIDTGMIFIRNEHGSHNPKESMRMDDFILAADLLTRAMNNT